MGWFSDITDSISNALGTDGSNNGLLPSVSNALGTDGSKNGLLNDPAAMAAAAAVVMYFTGTDFGLSAATGGGAVASTDAAAAAASSFSAGAAVADAGFSVAASDAAFSSALAASETAGASSLFSLPSWLTASNVLGGLSTASKFLGSGSRQVAQPMYGSSPNYYTVNNQTNPTRGMGQAAAAGPDLTLIAIAAAALLLMK
jgi:hypothetical protein